MYEVIGITFENSKRVYYFLPNDIECKKKSKVIVETERGMQLGTICSDIITISDDQITTPIKKIIRLATTEDIIKQKENEKKALEALEDAKTISKKLNLNMKFVNCYYTLDRNQLIFNFSADDRIDFRELAKKLASLYKTRIELRQIGVRDKAKSIGGIGPCGRFLCCSSFLNDFNSVSINMAKNQYLSLNPTKINGLCGRLLCCLKYEDNAYTELKKDFPPIGTKLKVGEVEGKVIGHNLFKKTYTIEKKDKTILEVKKD